MIQRTEYLNKLISYRDKNIIKVITGVRRCGKSTLFALYREYLKSTGVAEEQIISVNLEDLEYEELLNYRKLYNYVTDRLSDSKMNYVFIDEVQNCKSFEKAVDSLFIKENVDIYVTGSNAYMLSGELATLLSGRYIAINMLPLSFNEYCEAVSDSKKTSAETFNDYLTFGSFPYVAFLEQNVESIYPYLEGIYSTILLKDVAVRSGITDISVLENIVKTLASIIGSPVSVKKIADTINSTGRQISVNTVAMYMQALTDSYIFYKADRYDIKGRQHLKTLGKYYIVDTGLRKMLLSQGSQDIGHVIENIVYLELRRRGYKVNIGKLDQQEVDFVASGPNGIEYFQVAASVTDPNTLRRELSSLEKIADNYPKWILTLDQIGSGTSYKGIKQLYLVEWLLKSESAIM